MTTDAELVGRAHQRSSALLRRWLAETHTPVTEGPLEVAVGPLRLRTDVGYASPTGAHGFGPVRVINGKCPVAVAEPVLLAAACAADAQARALPSDPINDPASSSLVDWAVRAPLRGEIDPLELNAELAALACNISDAGQARSWLAGHVESRLLPVLRARAADVPEEVTAELLTGELFAVIGVLGRRGVVPERELLDELAGLLPKIAEAYPETERLIDRWLAAPTVTARAALNGSGLRYRDGGEVRLQPVAFEVPNPLWQRPAEEVPGVPVPDLGEGWSLRPVELTGADGGPDAALVHRWMNTEHVAVNWHQDWPLDKWRAELETQLGGAHSLPCIVSRDGREVAYLELYRVTRDKLARCYPHHPHDLGVHIAIGEPDAIGRGFGSALLRAVAEGLLAADPQCRRVVAEPNVHNAASVRAFTKAGFRKTAEIGLPNKNSALMVFERG